MLRSGFLALAGMAAALLGLPAQAQTALRADGTHFLLDTSGGRRLTSEQMVGAVLEVADGRGGISEVRIDAVVPAKDNPKVMLHTLIAKDATGAWRPLCAADAYGRRAGFPVKGRFEGTAFVADEAAWFLACTSGSQGKCVLWGYDPWGRAPDGRPLADAYRACQQMVRADYEGRDQPHTRNGTTIDTADVYGVQAHETATDPGFAFEAGWGPKGAVCVARTRWPDLLSLETLLASTPQLGGRCDEESARARGAILFTRVQIR